MGVEGSEGVCSKNKLPTTQHHHQHRHQRRRRHHLLPLQIFTPAACPLNATFHGVRYNTPLKAKRQLKRLGRAFWGVNSELLPLFLCRFLTFPGPAGTAPGPRLESWQESPWNDFLKDSRVRESCGCCVLRSPAACATRAGSDPTAKSIKLVNMGGNGHSHIIPAVS